MNVTLKINKTKTIIKKIWISFLINKNDIINNVYTYIINMDNKTTVMCIGDPHFKTENTIEVEIFTTALYKYLEEIENKPDIIIVLGDILDTHERIHTVVLNIAYDFIKKLREIAPTYVLVGNHDMCNNRQFLTENHWMNAIKEWDNTTIVDKVVSITSKNNHKFTLCPYVETGRFLEALNTNSDWNKADCIFAHQEFSGCKMGAILSIDGDKWCENGIEIISGHIHSNQRPQKNIYYPGSSMQHAFGESEKNIIAMVTFTKNDKKYILNEIDLKMPRKKIIYLNAEDMDTYELPKTEDKIKVSISGVYEQFKSFKKTKKYKDLVKEGVKIIFKPKRIEIKEQKEKTYEFEDNNFNDILNKLVLVHKNKYLIQTYELVVNNKKIETDDTFFI